MAKATRDDHRIIKHHGYDTDDALLVARYNVEGVERRLMVSMWMSSNIEDGDEAVLEALLKMCDEEAQWCAENPELVEEYRLRQPA